MTAKQGFFFLQPGSSGADLSGKNDAQRIILVMFLGGCTFSEISALRFLGRERGKPARLKGNLLLPNKGRIECCSFNNLLKVKFKKKTTCCLLELHKSPAKEGL